MRLICPSCGAQYEVDESVIPDGGRDVQCSNCGHAWFQRSARQLKADADDAERKAAEVEAAEPEETAPETPEEAAPEMPEAAAEPSADEAADEAPEEVAQEAEPEEAAPEADTEEAEEAPVGEPETVPVEEPDLDEAEPQEPEGAEEAAAASPSRPRKTLDDAVRNVLREEAERETRARVAEGSAVESQPDLGLTAAIGVTISGAAGRAAEAPQDRVASLDDDHDFDDDALMSRASRRELLPDIEEINSTLRATSERGDEAASLDAPETLARRRSGFRMGFSTALVIAILVLGLYLIAPAVARMVPALEPALTSYVATVDAIRMWLDDRMQALTESIKGP